MENTGHENINSYDQVPYLEISHSSTHPDILATVGTLLGLTPVNIKNCRVLELGCANGSNLIPMALDLPGSEFLGLDSSGVQIAQGRHAIENLGLANIKLKQLNILDADSRLGQFDYIIAHGIFSWVPDKVRDKILSICNRNLSVEGIAYVSYNTFPGWYLRKITRDMMLYHTRKISEPLVKIDGARNFLNTMATLAESLVKQSKSQLGGKYFSILKTEKERLEASPDAYLFHEDLEENNDPLYFYQFAEWVTRHGLQYLSEVSLNTEFMNDLPSEIKDKLVGMADDIIELEQYGDFLMNRFFRSTLLVHQDLKIFRKINADRISTLFVGSNCLPVSPSPDIFSRLIEEFVSSSGIKLATDHPVTKAAMLCLGQIWPEVVPMDELLEMAYERLRKASPEGEMPMPENPAVCSEDMQVLKANLLKGFASSNSLVELHVHAPRLTTQIREYPIASPWARFEVSVEADRLKNLKGEKREPSTVTNLRHERVNLEGVTPYLLYQLDGNCSRDELLARLEKCLEDGSLVIPKMSESQPEDSQKGNGPQNAGQVKQYLAKNLELDLQWLARAALLVA